MSWSTGYGFNFRSTTAFVTDGANEFVVRGNTVGSGAWVAPVTFASGVVGGWESDTPATSNADVNASRDRRLAGHALMSNSTGPQFFLLTLPAAGDYEIGLAFSSSVTATRIELFDDTTSLLTLTPSVADASGLVADATGTTYTFANWPSNQTLVTETFATTALELRIGNNSGSNSTRLHHLFVRQVSGGAVPFRPYYITG
jgi:hypothetical protein